MSAWTEELKQQVVDMYKEAGPTAENSTEIIQDIAKETKMSPNGVRMVLVQAGVYVKKEPASGTKAGGAKKAAGEGAKRVSKEDAIAELRKAIEDKGAEVDEDIISKMTGKAAQYFTKVLAS